MYAPFSTLYRWNWPSTVLLSWLSSTPSLSLASSSSHFEPRITLMTFQPGAAEHRLELLDDLAVAAHRPVEALQVAVDDEDQVVEALAAGERQRPECFRLVALAIAEERPDAAGAGVVELAILEIAVEPGLVERGERAEAHADGRVLPEVGHQPRVRVARQTAAAAADLAAEVVEIVVGQPALHERPGVHAGRGMALEVDVVAGQCRRPCHGRSG